MRGIVFDGQNLLLTDALEVRDPGPGEVLVRMLASGICHSDLNVVDGVSPRPAPIVLGHEGAAEVVRRGPDVAGFDVGDRVVIATITPCRTCRACVAGRLSDCSQAFGSGETPFTYRGTPTLRYANCSSWAEEVVVRATQLFPIGALAPTGAALLGCAVSTGWGCVQNVAGVAPGDTVAVIGIGGIGANVVQAARLAGAARVIALDVNELRRESAVRFGATDVVIAARDDDLVAAVRDLTGAGVDHAFECAGLVPTVEAAIAMTAPGGTAVLIGMPPRGARVSFDVTEIFRGRRIVGSLNGACDPARDFPTMIDHVTAGRLDLDALVTEVFPLSRSARRHRGHALGRRRAQRPRLHDLTPAAPSPAPLPRVSGREHARRAARIDPEPRRAAFRSENAAAGRGRIDPEAVGGDRLIRSPRCCTPSDSNASAWLSPICTSSIPIRSRAKRAPSAVSASRCACSNGASFRGSIYSAQPIAVDRPIWRVDLLESVDTPPGSFDRTHHHPHFDGWEPGHRVFVDALSADPLGWLAARLADFASVLVDAGVDLHEVPTADVDELRDTAPEILAATRSLLTRVHAGGLAHPLPEQPLDNARAGWL